MRKSLASFLFVIIVLLVGAGFTNYVNGNLGIFSLVLLFVFFVSIFIMLVVNKSRSVAYKIISGAFVALMISLIFNVLYHHANSDFNNSEFFIFFMNMVSVTMLAIVIGVILYIYMFIKKRIEK